MNVENDPTLRRMIPGPIHSVHAQGAKGPAEIVPEPMYIIMRWDSYLWEFDDSIFVWKNGKWLTIKYPIPAIRYVDDLRKFEELRNELQPFLNSLVFGEAKLAYFIQRDDGRRAIVYRRRLPLYCRIKHLRVVHQDEVTFLRPAQGLDNIEVLWRGRQCMCLKNSSHIKLIAALQIVDMRLVNDERSLAYLEEHIKG